MGPNLVQEEGRESKGSETACVSVVNKASTDSAKTAKSRVKEPSTSADEDDPFRSKLEENGYTALADCSEQPPTDFSARGFGLLPYLRKKRLHEDCFRHSDDFTVESLLSTPSGTGSVPVRPFSYEKVFSSKGDNSNAAEDALFDDSGRKKDDDQVHGDGLLEGSVRSTAGEAGFSKVEPIKVECSEQPSASGKMEIEGAVRNKEFRAHVAAQSNLFAIKCKCKKWKIGETSMIDSYMDKLQATMEEYRERLNQIQEYSLRHPGNVQQFLKTVFNSRPFLEVDRRKCIVDMCLNTYATYPVKKKETIPRKAFNAFVNNVREKLRSKQEIVSPVVVIPAEIVADSKGDDLVEENVPLSPEPEKDKSSSKIPQKKLKSPTVISTPSVRRIIVPPPLPPRRYQDKRTSSDENASRDVLLGIINTMDDFEPSRRPTAFNQEFLDEMEDTPLLNELVDEDALSKEGAPIPKRMRYDDEYMGGPSTSASFSPTMLQPKVSSPLFINITEDKATVPASTSSTPASFTGQKMHILDISKPRKHVSFSDETIVSPRPSPHASTPTSLDPLSMRRALDRIEDGRSFSNSMVKKVKVNYADDPYIYMAAKTTKASSSASERPPRIKVQLSASESLLEDPYASFCAKREDSASIEGGTKNSSSSTDIFRSTFSSLHDRVSCSLATFNIKKPRTIVKWKLIPCTRNRKESLKSLPPGANSRDPRLARLFCREQEDVTTPLMDVEREEEVMDRSRAVLSKSYRKNPTRCIEEKSVSNIRSRLAFRSYCRRISYPQKLNLNAEIQYSWNKQTERQPQEISLMKCNLIPKWGSANPKRSLFPFGKTDGMYWPIVQPFDDINLADDRHVICADTRNQLVCLSELTFASKQTLFCGRDDKYHYRRFMQAVETDESMWAPGRFQNRIGYERVFCTQTIEDARQKDEERQLTEAAWMKRLVEADAVNLNQTADDDRSFQRAFQPNSAIMADHVDFNLSDIYSKREELIGRGACTSAVQPHICKGTRGPSTIPRNWFEVPISKYMPTTQRKDYLVQYTNFRNKLTNQYKPNTGNSVSYEDLVQYHLSAIKAIFIHQNGYNDTGLTSQFSEQILEKAKERDEEISSELKSGKISIEKLKKLCELQDWEEKYWTIIWDNLANIYRDAPPVSQLKIEQFIIGAFETAANVPQRDAYFDRFWEIVERTASNY